MRRIVITCVALLTVASGSVALVAPPAGATVLPADDEVTYKEYWVPHSQFSGGCSAPLTPNWYVEPSPCDKKLTFTIPDDAQQAVRAEIYLDLWRNRDVPGLRFRLNSGALRDPGVGADFSRTPYVGEVPLSELRQGTNTITLSSLEMIHVHDIAIRVYHDASHPLVAGAGSDVTPPSGRLTSIVAANGTFPPTSGGTLAVDNDTLRFNATASDAKYVEFIGAYEWYDIDNDGITNEWQATGRNNWFKGGTTPQAAGGTINHLGTDTTAPYSVQWKLPTVPNQSGVRFKIRVVDAAGNVREAAGGVSQPFTLTRSDEVELYRIPDFVDASLHADGHDPDQAVRTIELPGLENVTAAYLLGNYWKNPRISLNGNTSFAAFASGEDVWKTSVRSLNLTHIGRGRNFITYSYSGTGYGEFVEEPGPMVVLRRKIVNPAAPTITQQPTPATVSPNMPALLGAAVAGSPTPSLQWQRLVAGQWTDVAGATSAAYTTPRITTLESGTQFRLVATNRLGAVASAPVTVTVGAVAPWWNTTWPYRVEVDVNAQGVARSDKVAEADINFTKLMESFGEPGVFDPTTIRVVEIGPTGAVIDDDILAQFQGGAGYNTATNAQGTVVFRMDGTTAATATRRFHVYFAKTGSGIPPLSLPSNVRMIDNVMDEGQSSVRVETATATYVYQKAAGGFSSLLDRAGRDWLSYNSTAGGGGTYRGMPNAVFPEGYLHPGSTASTTVVGPSGPLKASVVTTTFDGQWALRWDFYPTHAKATFTKAPKPYWFLYEGTPGGTLSNTADVVVRANGTRTTAGTKWVGDLVGEEWVFVGDPAAGQSVFVANHDDDNAVDSYYSMSGLMTVFGFGRRETTPLVHQVPGVFSVGLIDSTDYATAAPRIRDLYRPLHLTSGLGERASGPGLPGKPSAVQATPIGGGARVSWTPPVVTGGNPISSYTVSPSPTGAAVVVPGTVTEVDVRGLTPGQPHTFTVRATTGSGDGPSSDPSMPVVPLDDLGLVSDDFNDPTLDTTLWRVLSSSGDVDIRTPGTELVLRVPTGTPHDFSTRNTDAPRILQAVADGDFQTELAWATVPSANYQAQGLLAIQDADNWLRFDVLYGPSGGRPAGLRVGASVASGGVFQQLLDVAVASGSVRFLRVTRTGDEWQLEHSGDGATWSVTGRFTHSIAVTEVGPFAANNAPNSKTAPPLFISRLDYIFNTARPIVPEDPVTDTTPMVFANVVTTGSESRVQVTWDTDELSSGIVEIGRQPGTYDLGATSATPVDFHHRAVVEGLQPQSTYYVRIRATDVRGMTATSEELRVDTLAPGQGDAIVDIWYGLRQRFGFIGRPQRWINILGNVQDLDGIAFATYSVNGGAERQLTIGRDDRRLNGRPGDFNVDVLFTSLLRGINVIKLKFVDTFGTVITRDVEVEVETAKTWPLPYSIDWSRVTNIQDVAQVVDGKWAVTPDGVRPLELGYDRLVGLGDISWDDYEVTVPVTIHGIDEGGFAFPSVGPVVGLVLRWPGHYEWDSRQPAWGYSPLGSMGVYRFQATGFQDLILTNGKGAAAVSGGNAFRLSYGTTYLFRMRVQTVRDGANPGHRYTLTVWPKGQSEQSGLTITTVAPLTDQANGGVLLVAHHVDATFGNVLVQRVNPATTPQISPAGGSFTSGQVVTLSSSDPSARIHYTLDGSDPTAASPVYQGPFVLNIDATVKAAAVRPGIDVSPAAEGRFQIRPGTPIVSDAFNTGSVDTGRWTLLDPVGDTVYVNSGTQFGLWLPAGVVHDLHTGSFTGPRLLQAAPDTDFAVEAKFDGSFSGTYTMQGIVAQQTSRDLIRVDVYRTGSARRVFAGTMVNGKMTGRIDRDITGTVAASGPVWLRLLRRAGTFTVLWSGDGATWTEAGSFDHAFELTAIGPWVGASSVPSSATPGMLGIVDYFRNLDDTGFVDDPTTPPNVAPAVNAGVDTAAVAQVATVLRGGATDDGVPAPSNLTWQWSQVAGPAPAQIADYLTGRPPAPVKYAAQVTFPEPGRYQLRLTVDDGERSNTDDVVVTVTNPAGAPTVVAGGTRTVLITSAIELDGSVADDGQPGPVQVHWEQTAGPGEASIASPDTVDSSVTFPVRGTYQFRLTATDGTYTSRDYTEITVIEPRATDGLLALYDFLEGGGTTVRDVSGVGPALDLAIGTPSKTVWNRHGLRVTGEATIASSAPAAKIADAVKASNELTLEAWIEPDNLSQNGPARIVTISKDASARNVTLGQGDGLQTSSLLDIRLRTTATSTNGIPALTTSAGSLHLGLNHVVYTRDASGTANVYVDGRLVATGSVAGTLDGWDSTQVLALANELGGERPWRGTYRLVALYGRALTSDEVATNFQHGSRSITANTAPTITLPSTAEIRLPATLELAAVVADDGRPSGSSLLHSWSKVSGAGDVEFSARTSPSTSVSFAQAGTYVLRLTVDDGEVATSADITVTVLPEPPNEAPVVDAGPDLVVELGSSGSLDATVTDDGFPAPPGAVTVQWAKVSGPGTVTFGQPTGVDTSVTAADPGRYVLSLTADDGRTRTTDAMVLDVVRPARVPSGVVALYDFAEGSGAVVHDLSEVAPAIDLTIEDPDAVRWADGALVLERAGRVQSTTATAKITSAVQATGGVTIEAWVAPTAVLPTVQGRVVLLGRTAFTRNVVLTQGLSSPTAQWVGYPRTNGTVTTSVTAVTNTALQHVVLTVDTSGGVQQLYVDGRLRTTKTLTGDFSTWGPTHPLVLGADLNGANPWLGAFHLVAVYGRALGASEIGRNFLAGPWAQPPPVVDAGVDIVDAPQGLPVALDATVLDDGLPQGTITTSWSQVSGPGPASFADPSAVDTTVTFPVGGTYVLRLTASDGAAAASDTMSVTVAGNAAPTVSAGADQTIEVGTTATLDGTVSDDGRPNGVLTSTWSKESGPGTVTFAAPGAVDTTATFSAAGVYTLRLTASDGVTSSGDDVVVTVKANAAPAVDAGADVQTAANTSTALTGTVTDDGLPTAGTLAVTWSQQSGPAPVAFTDRNTAVTSAIFPAVGSYVLSLAASDGALTASDTVVVTVAPAPVSNRAALVTSTAAPLPAQDALIAGRLERLGYTVVAVDDDALTPAAFSEVDVVVISSSIVPSKVPAWMGALTIPIVNTEGYAHKTLLLATGNGEATSQTTVTITTSGHPIAGGLSGSQTVTSSAVAMAWAVPVVSATVVALVPGTTRAAAFAVDAGAALTTGTAPARRVGLHFGYDTPSVSTAAGWSLFDSAVRWAAG